MTFQEKLIEMCACDSATEWVGDKTVREAWDTCHRADWMLWLLYNFRCDLRTLTHCKVVCAEYAREKMTDPRSIAALNGAWAFVRGEIGEVELNRLAAAAAAAYYAADGVGGAADAAYAAAYAASAYAAAADAADAAADARYPILSQMANDIRKIVNADFVENLVQNSAMHS